MSHRLAAVPPAALVLGAAGLAPFLLGAAAALGLPVPGPWGRAFMPYAAVILSFMAGIHWGIAMVRDEAGWRQLGISVGPALVGWASLLVGGASGLVVLAIAFTALLGYDLAEARAGRAPAWYPTLRWPLTLIVVVCLLAVALIGPPAG